MRRTNFFETCFGVAVIAADVDCTASAQTPNHNLCNEERGQSKLLGVKLLLFPKKSFSLFEIVCD